VEDEFLFGAFTFSEEVDESLLKSELSLFWQVIIPEDDLKDPLAWWKKHECQYPHVGFLARQSLGIPRSQIETKCIFSIASVLLIRVTTWMPWSWFAKIGWLMHARVVLLLLLKKVWQIICIQKMHFSMTMRTNFKRRVVWRWVTPSKVPCKFTHIVFNFASYISPKFLSLI
jgi:hypothetical protein